MTNKPQDTVVFFHGLNTFGDDLLHVGPVKLGRMDQHLKSAFLEKGIQFISVEKVGNGTPQSQADWSIQWLKANAPQIEGTTVTLLGNSIGGIVARALAKKLRENKTEFHFTVRQIITWGTPHRGTPAADLPSYLQKKFPRAFPHFKSALERMNYSIEEKSATFGCYSPQQMDIFNSEHPIHPNTKEISLLCSVPASDVSPYFWSLYPYLHGQGPLGMAAEISRDYVLKSASHFAPSDGFVTNGSQSWGQVLGPYRLDHFVQMGFAELLLTKSKRTFARTEFQRLTDDLAELCRTL